MLIGYARVSTVDQNLSLQRDALTEAGCEHIYTEQLSGAVVDRPALTAALQFARKGDTLIVWKLDRLARSVKQLIETVEDLRVRHRVSESDGSDRHDDRTRAAHLSHVQRARGI
jgi:DNA invertase Pin-like site-specific DNA recombinase